MEFMSLPLEVERVYPEGKNRAAAAVIVMAARTEPLKGEVLKDRLWWHEGQGTRLPVVRQENRLRYYGPAWTYIEISNGDK